MPNTKVMHNAVSLVKKKPNIVPPPPCDVVVAVNVLLLLLLPVSDAMTLGFTKVQSLPIPVKHKFLLLNYVKNKENVFPFWGLRKSPWQQEKTWRHFGRHQ